MESSEPPLMQRNLVIEVDQLQQHARNQGDNITRIRLVVISGQHFNRRFRGPQPFRLRALPVNSPRLSRERSIGDRLIPRIPLVGSWVGREGRHCRRNGRRWNRRGSRSRSRNGNRRSGGRRRNTGTDRRGSGSSGSTSSSRMDRRTTGGTRQGVIGAATAPTAIVVVVIVVGIAVD